MKSKNVIRINESQLKQIVSESVKKVLKENDDFDRRYGNHEKDNVLNDFNELKDAILSIGDGYSFDDYLEHLESSIDALCGVVNEYQRVYYTEIKK